MFFYQTTCPKLKNMQHINPTKLLSIKDTHRANKSQALMNSMNMDILVVGTLNRLLISGFYTQIKFTKNKVVSGKTSFFVNGPFFVPHYICLNKGF